MTPVTIIWFRRDLRLNDNKALYYALKENKNVLPLFVFDENIIGALPADDHRVSFIYDALEDMNRQLTKLGSGLLVKRGKPMEVLQSLCEKIPVQSIYCNRDHEPYGRERDDELARFLKKEGVAFRQYTDHLIMGADEVLKQDEKPYQVFTPYGQRWRELLTEDHLKAYDASDLFSHFSSRELAHFPSRKELKQKESLLKEPRKKFDQAHISRYDENRDYPAREGTSRLGVHLRFGTISPREVVKTGRQWNQTFVNELIWREFYAMIMWYYPQVVTRSFKAKYDHIKWRNNEEEFERWKRGLTGYPMVDAGMRQLSETGYMHNRLRMLTASFLSKHLLIDWRWGEAWFGEKLFDYELSSNNGGWQWSAGTGCDAAPYFRIFNPETQQKKFDPAGDFVRAWVPEIDTMDYPGPIVDHRSARERCLTAYRKALDKQE